MKNLGSIKIFLVSFQSVQVRHIKLIGIINVGPNQSQRIPGTWKQLTFCCSNLPPLLSGLTASLRSSNTSDTRNGTNIPLCSRHTLITHLLSTLRHPHCHKLYHNQVQLSFVGLTTVTVSIFSVSLCPLQCLHLTRTRVILIK